ncbi:hypothetical protein [Solilutibacter silvestris]|uniref:hypothetical protein n=1 Tax=Solilutibacter silvestris TaxID=1645665 RepID=UPI003D358BEE
MQPEYKVRIVADASSLESAFEGISNAPIEVLDRFISGIKSLDELIRIDRDDLTTTAANELRIRLKPSDRFIEFLATLRAGN